MAAMSNIRWDFVRNNTGNKCQCVSNMELNSQFQQCLDNVRPILDIIVQTDDLHLDKSKIHI